MWTDWKLWALSFALAIALTALRSALTARKLRGRVPVTYQPVATPHDADDPRCRLWNGDRSGINWSAACKVCNTDKL